MVIYRFPPESGKEHQQGDQTGKKFEGKSPDFIYTDEERHPDEGNQGAFDQRQSFGAKDIKNASYPGFLRLLTLVVAAALSVWFCIISVVFLIVLVLAAVSLFQVPEVLKLVDRLWKAMGNLSAYALALYVATLNPAFGFGIIALYAMQHGENWENSAYGKIFTNRFGKNN